MQLYATLAPSLSRIRKGQEESLKCTSLEHRYPFSGRSRFTNGLVASSDDEILQRLAEVMGQCGIATFLAFTIAESRRILHRHEVSLILCDDRLIDGTYQDIVDATRQVQTATAVIVVSPTGDWADYLKAMNAGVFDYLAYPPILGELPRAVRGAMEPLQQAAEQETQLQVLERRNAND